MLLRDYHQFFEDANPVLIRQLKDQLRAARTTGKTLAILGCRLELPAELEREFAVIDPREQPRILGRVALPQPGRLVCGQTAGYLLQTGRQGGQAHA